MLKTGKLTGLMRADHFGSERENGVFSPGFSTVGIGPNTEAISAAMRPKSLGGRLGGEWSHMFGVF